MMPGVSGWPPPFQSPVSGRPKSPYSKDTSANPAVLVLRRNHELGRPRRTWPTVSVPLPSQSPTTGQPLSPYAKLRSAGPEELELRRSQMLRASWEYRPTVSVPSPSQSPTTGNHPLPKVNLRSATPVVFEFRSSQVLRLLGLFRSAGTNSPTVSTPSPSQSPESTNPSLDCASAGPAAAPTKKTPIVSVTAVATSFDFRRIFSVPP